MQNPSSQLYSDLRLSGSKSSLEGFLSGLQTFSDLAALQVESSSGAPNA